jgi:1-phosphofructokinase family hexose kinase
VILTVTPNATVDKTYRVEQFALNRVNRPSLTYTVAGGKGINVARVYQTLGGNALATGFLGGLQGRMVARAMAEEGIPDAFVRTRGETRLCIAIIDPTTGTQTEVNESGPEIPRRAVTRLKQRVASLLSQQTFDFVVLSGSLPPGVPTSLYAELVALAQAHQVRVVLDSSGAALREGIAARPWMVKPNRVELEHWAGRALSSEAEVFEAARTLAASVPVVALTLGEEGALLLMPESALRAYPPAIEFVSAVASGDSFVAGFLWAWEHGACPRNPEAALRIAVGAGAANAALIGAGFCSRESIFALAERAHIAVA